MGRELIGCEFSGVVRRAFAARGHDAWSCDLLPAEDGRVIEEFPDYVVTTFGRVLSLHKATIIALRPGADGKRYQSVNLRRNGEGRSYRIHRLVAQAFIANPENLPCVRHLDGDPANNRVENLAWGTYAENEADKLDHGTWDTRRNGKLSHDERNQVRAMARQGIPQKQIARVFGVSRPTITRLLNGAIWTNDPPVTEHAPTPLKEAS